MASEFQPLAQSAIARRDQRMQSASGRSDATHALIPDFLDDLAGLIDHHPSNRDWFFALLDAADPRVQKAFLQYQLMCFHSESYWLLLVDRLTRLLDEHPDLLDLGVVAEMLGHGVSARLWLEAHFDRILELCLTNPKSRYVTSLAQEWDRLKDALRGRVADWDDAAIIRRRERPSLESDAYLGSPAYLYLNSQYEQAKHGNRNAFDHLVQVARRWNANIPMRAVATNFIGQLPDAFDTFPALAWLMRIGDVNWDPFRFDSPIRYEAGEALLRMPTPAVWETLVDSYFIYPRDDLLSFQIAWIDHLTDVLSGETSEYKGIHYGDVTRRSWFQALSEVSEEELAQLVK